MLQQYETTTAEQMCFQTLPPAECGLLVQTIVHAYRRLTSIIVYQPCLINHVRNLHLLHVHYHSNVCGWKDFENVFKKKSPLLAKAAFI